MSRWIIGLVMAATIIIGLLTGGNFDRAFVAIPAWHEVGSVGWADFSRHADLGNGLFVYPVMAIGGTAISVIAAVLFMLRGRSPRAAAVPIFLAAAFAVVSLPFSLKATPYMLSLRHITDSDLGALGRAFSGYEFWGHLQGIFHLASFMALVWSLTALGRAEQPQQTR